MGWLLPPALALAAVVLQFVIDVPHHAMIVHEDPKPAEKKTTAARTPRPRADWRPRGAAYTKRLRKSWSGKPIADEPKDTRFADHHEELLRALGRKAEAAAIPGAEAGEVTTHAVCHTIRCELELCAPTQIAAEVLAQLPNFEVGNRSLWHELREIGSKHDDGRTCQRYIVDFAVEGADPRRLRLAR